MNHWNAARFALEKGVAAIRPSIKKRDKKPVLIYGHFIILYFQKKIYSFLKKCEIFLQFPLFFSQTLANIRNRKRLLYQMVQKPFENTYPCEE